MRFKIAFYLHLQFLEAYAHPPVPVPCDNPPSYSLAVAADGWRPSELGCVFAFMAADGDGGVTGGGCGFLWHCSMVLKISYATWGTHAFPKALMASALHFGKEIPASPREIPSSLPQTGD